MINHAGTIRCNRCCNAHDTALAKVPLFCEDITANTVPWPEEDGKHHSSRFLFQHRCTTQIFQFAAVVVLVGGGVTIEDAEPKLQLKPHTEVIPVAIFKLYPVVNCRYKFHNDVMSVEGKGTATSFSRLCVQKVGRNKFLVAHEEEGQTNGKYTCVQFLRRDRAILQTREARLSDELNSALCEDTNLHLNGWIIVDYNDIKKRREVCSLTGGFNMQVYDKATNQGLCDAYEGETRMESECLAGEGMHFYFRQAACVPDGLLMYPSQRTLCLVNWTVGQFTFILLTDTDRRFMWVLRYPSLVAQGMTLQALLLKDLYATKESSLRATDNYLILTMSSQSAKTLQSLCYDDYEICSVLSDPCSYSDDIARTCAKTCGFCTDTSLTVCQLDIPNLGLWTDSDHHSTKPTVNVSSTALEVDKTETLHCIRWSTTPGNGRENKGRIMSSEDGNKYRQQMLVSVTSNGCRPRFTCGRFIQMNQVLFVHLSQTKLWPLVATQGDAYDCSDFQFSSSNIALDDNPYRTNQSSLLTVATPTSVLCDLSHFQQQELLFMFGNGENCVGLLRQNTAKTNLQPTIENCLTNILSTTYTCIEYASFAADKLLVSQSDEAAKPINCWLFPFDNKDTIYLTESIDCNHETRARIKDGSLIPIATVTKMYGQNGSTKTPGDTNTSVIIDAISTTLRPFTTEFIDTDTENKSNSSDTEKEQGAVEPAVAGAAAFVTAVLVITALLCKCKC